MTKNTEEQRYRIGIVLSGEVLDETGFLRILSACDFIICADGGAKHLRKYGILPDLLVGDLDSITQKDLNWFEQAQIPLQRHQPEKDYTDSELAVTAALELLAEELKEKGLPRPPNRDISIGLLAVTGPRPDHILGNQLMAAHLAREQYDVFLADGKNLFYLLEGPAKRTFTQADQNKDSIVSVIALSEIARGVTYQGLQYPLDNFDLNLGSQRGLSNRPADINQEEYSISLEEGTIMIVITKETVSA